MSADQSPPPEWLPLLKPRYQATALVLTALRTLGEYPEDSPDYDAMAVGHLRLALALLAPGFGDLEHLGDPRPACRFPPIDESPEEPARGPDWVSDVLAEVSGSE